MCVFIFSRIKKGEGQGKEGVTLKQKLLFIINGESESYRQKNELYWVFDKLGSG